MKRKIILKRKHKKYKKIYILIIFMLITIYITIEYINKNIAPKLTHYAEIEIRKLSGVIITESIKTENIEKLNMNDMFIITKNQKNEILTVDINTVTLNEIIKNSTTELQKRLKKIEMGIIDENNKNGVILKIPIGEIYNNFLLTNLGPKIPVKLKVLGDIESKINTNIKNYGINNALIEVSLEISVREEVLLPISTSEIEVKQIIPIAIKMITGTVPNYYSNGINKSETLSIPIE